MRYEKQLIFKHIQKQGQDIINNSSVAIIGCGALGSVCADLLARAGIKKLILYDSDIVELSNLQRQTLYNNNDLEKLKVDAAKDALKKINPELEVEINPIRVNHKNIDIKANLIIDGTDNLETRFIINDFCSKTNTPWIMGAIAGSRGFILPIISKEQPCFRCIFEHVIPAATCNSEGVINTIVHLVASYQVTLALKQLLNQTIEPKLLIIDIWENLYNEIKINKDPSCNTCQGKYDFLEGKFEDLNDYLIEFCETKDSYRVMPKKTYSLDLNKISKILSEVKFQNDLVCKGTYDGIKLKIHSYGEILFLSETDENKRNKIGEKLSSIRK